MLKKRLMTALKILAATCWWHFFSGSSTNSPAEAKTESGFHKSAARLILVGGLSTFSVRGPEVPR